MNGLPVVTAGEMRRLEEGAYQAGESDQQYMETAGQNLANALEKILILPDDPIHLLIGKGNNGGDAFVLGTHLLKKGFHVEAHLAFPKEECSKLSQKMHTRFVKAGGKCTPIQAEPSFTDGILVDGLLGTGFQGGVEGILAEIIQAANRSKLPIYAIDIPSGLNGDTGEVATVAIHAETTFYLGLPKLGFFLDRGWNHVGKLIQVSFGMPERFYEEIRVSAYLLSEEKAAEALPPLTRSRHKYEAGYVLAVAGSADMPGAALLACLAALKSGAGIIRLFHPEEIKPQLVSAPYELIREGWDLKDTSRIVEETNRAKSLLIGPGMGRAPKAHLAIKNILSFSRLPTVVDADALYFLDEEMPLPEKTILTPHHGEMKRILNAEPTLEACDEYVREKNVTLVLKGGPTIIFHPHTKPLIVPHGDPGMATAGTGDVLTGVLAALLAQGLDLRTGAALGVYLHALAGEIAARSETSYGVIATDLIHHLPDAIQLLVKE